MTRKDWMSLLAKAPPKALDALWDAAPEVVKGAVTWLRAPEAGAVMVRGRTGAVGAPFNLGEMTVTRCSLRTVDGTVGHAYVQGRDKTHAERAARIDAGMQTDAAAAITAAILSPLDAQMRAAKTARAAKAAATKVDFFTMVRGE